MDNMNIDENTVNKLKDMMNKGQLNDVISQIPPEMMQNFSSMMSNSSGNGQNTSGQQQNQNSSNTNQNNNTNGNNNSNPSNGFDFSNIDMNTILKMQSVMGKLNNSNDPRSNLLHSLKPYMRDEKKGKIDQYANLLNMANLTDLFKPGNNKENDNNG